MKVNSKHMVGGLMMLVGVTTTAALWGLDFGYHWDEDKILTSVQNSYKTGRFLPGWYQYPSLCYALGLLANPLSALWQSASTDVEALRLTLRVILIVLSMCTAFWTFGVVRIWRRNTIEALLAAGIVCLSFELNYHSRWIAPDTLMMQFGIGSIYMLTRVATSKSNKLRWLLLAALMAGLSCGSKYPGGLFLLPIATGIFLTPANEVNVTQKLRWFVGTLGVFIITFIAITPGALIDTAAFISDVQSEIAHYRRGHGTYGVEPGFEHLREILTYVLLVATSPYPVLGYAMGTATIVGFLYVLRSGDRHSVSVLIVPIVYLLYFSSQRVMIVRNLLVLLPFIAILASIGISALLKWTNQKWLTNIGYGSLAMIGIAHAVFMFSAADSIRNPIPENRGVQAFIKAHPKTQFVQSKGKPTLSPPLGQQAKTDVDTADQAWVIFWSDVKPTPKWVTNQKQTYQIVSGSKEVNWSYYPSWRGSPRLLAVRKADAQKMGIITSK